MSIRTQLLISYLVLILLLTLGFWAVAKRVLDNMTAGNMKFSEQGAMAITTANDQLARQILTAYGEYIVKDKAQDVANELAHVLAGRKTFNYEEMRRDPRIRKIALQTIFTPHGPAGYTDLYDRHGHILFHPDPKVEGHNQLDWEKRYPQTTAMIKRSFQEDQVTGYYTFFDKDNKERKRFSARIHVPGTPFIVAAIVNIDEYFLPVQEKMKKSSQTIVARADLAITKHSREMERTVKIAVLSAGAFFSLLGLLMGFYFAASISRPLRRLQKGVKAVGEGNFAVAVPEKGFKEVVYLAKSFNLLGQRLIEYIAKRDFVRDTFGRYVTQEVVKRLLELEGAQELGGETREVTILISDLRGFTALTADMEPEEVVTFLNRYLARMIEILTDHRAVIDEIVGDGILAFFGAPEPMEDHPVQAVACALAMQAAMDEVNARNHADGLPHLEMGIAVNTGQVVVGNIGSETRTKYSVVGSHVNFASRIEGYAVGGQVLIGPATFQRVRDRIDVGETITVAMKGIPGQTTLYEVQGIGEPFNIHLPERYETLTPLPEKIPAHLQRLSEKIVIGETAHIWITHLSETAATIILEGELGEWEDVRLHLLDESGQEIRKRLYGKVTAVKPGEGHLKEAQIRFTSVAPEIYPIILKAIGRG
jgi:class 3 adenylate cyclase